jgi:hypothetical protein
MPAFNVKVTAVGDGDDADLGTTQVVANTSTEAESLALDKLWDARLDCAGCTPEFETTLRAKYLVSDGWGHVFDKGERMVRFVFDTELQQVIFMEVETSSGWQATTKVQMADVTDSLVNANEEVLTNPEDEGLGAVDVLPTWAAKDASAVPH